MGLPLQEELRSPSGDCPSGRETAGVPPALLLPDPPRPLPGTGACLSPQSLPVPGLSSLMSHNTTDGSALSAAGPCVPAFVQEVTCGPGKCGGEGKGGGRGAGMRRPQYSPLGQNDPEGWVGPSDHRARAHDTGRPGRAHGKALARAAVQAGAAPYPQAPPMPGGSPAQPRGQRRWTAVTPRVATTVSTAKTTPAAQTP